jgi:3-hydroxybutyrate dehydrogenase
MNIPVKPQMSQSPRALAGKVALVTGSTSGIGLGIALPVDGGWTAH